MKYILPLLLVVFISCSKVENDTDLVCTEDCTTITGKVYTHSDIPVKNVLMKFKFRQPNTEGPNLTRIISQQKSNSEGLFELRFYVKDEEVASEFGSFDLYPHTNSLPNNVFFGDFEMSYAFNIKTRDFSRTQNIYFPTPKKVKIRLKNFQGIDQNDYFSVSAIIPCGFDKAEIDSETGNNHNYTYSSNDKNKLSKFNNETGDKLFEINLALNELNYIRIGRMKNMQYTEELIPVNVTPDTNQVFEYTY